MLALKQMHRLADLATQLCIYAKILIPAGLYAYQSLNIHTYINIRRKNYYTHVRARTHARTRIRFHLIILLYSKVFPLLLRYYIL